MNILRQVKTVLASEVPLILQSILSQTMLNLTILQNIVCDINHMYHILGARNTAAI